LSAKGELGPMETKSVMLYKFEAAIGLQFALATDNSGQNLPAGGAPWKLLGVTKVEPGKQLIGASSDEILAAIQRNGYFIYPKNAQQDK
jgi:hypothetical protein